MLMMKWVQHRFTVQSLDNIVFNSAFNAVYTDSPLPTSESTFSRFRADHVDSVCNYGDSEESFKLLMLFF